MNTILCPTDFSTCADNAIAYAHELAIRTHSHLILFNALFVPEVMQYRGWHVSVKAAHSEERLIQNKLVQICQELKNINPLTQVSYTTKLDYRLTAETIAHTAGIEKADLIVMGTSGAKGLQEIVMGSTTADVIEVSKSPVLVIPQTGLFKPLSRIVIATDLTEDKKVDIAVVLTLTKVFESEIMFLHVLDEADIDLQNRAITKYRNLYSLNEYDKVSFHTQQETDIEKGILAFNQQVKGDMIVMVNHKRNFWQDLFSKSQTRRLSYHSPVPLMAIHN